MTSVHLVNSTPRLCCGRTCTRSIAAIVLSVLLLGLAGCDEPEGIVVYKVPNQVPAQLLPGKDRMLAVIVPRGDQVWFFKVVGPEDAIALVADRFREFVTNLQFDSSGQPRLDALPDGWRKGSNKPLRFATIDINTEKKQLDLSVSSLSNSAQDWDKYVIDNVNRWRGQVGLNPSSDPLAGGQPIEIAAAEGQSVWVDVTGQPDATAKSSMGAMGAGNPHGESFPGLSAADASGNPAMESNTSPPSGARPGAVGQKLTYAVPENWQEQDVTRGGMREAAFKVGQAEVTVITAGGDLRSNVARWMGQVAQQQPADAEVDAMMSGAEKLQVSGRPAQRFVIAGDPQKGQNSIDATIVEMENGQSKFVKMTGDATTVNEQKEAMRTFLDSLSF